MGKKSTPSPDTQELCMALMRADTEAEVIALLSAAGYWDDPACWRNLGDDEGNYSTIGNQQSEAIAALIEKIINSVDARLTNACLEAGIDPTSPSAPQSIREAVALFFEDKNIETLSERDGRVAFWEDNEKITAHGRLITVAATGHKAGAGSPSISIADQGEGQTPDAFPDTFMSLHRQNKLRIPFVQGKFNMGGTGALVFSGDRHRVQLIVSRRNPALVGPSPSHRDHEWGFTIVRRVPPVGMIRSSVFTYLAPGDRVLSFSAPTWPIFPEADAKVRDAYHRHAPHGTLVKLYEYKWRGTSTNVVLGGGALLRRLDQGFPELALPVRIYECRLAYKGHAGSFATNVLGLSARLERDRAEKLEAGFPAGSVIDIDGRQVTATIFAFKKGVAGDYRTAGNGVLFSINGQTHASLPTDLFRRQSVGMSYLADSLLVTVDCTSVEGELREDLFMNSRDRLRDNAMSARLVDELEDVLKNDAALRTLRNRRREEDLADKLSDSKPLSDVLKDLLRRSPTLAKLFLQGLKLPSPFPPDTVTIEGGDRNGGQFKARTYPTYFKFRGKSAGTTLTRDAYIGSRVRVHFETDAEDNYFVRASFPGERAVWRVLQGGEQVPLTNWRMDGPRSGIVTLSVGLPDQVAAGNVLNVDVEVTDEMRIDPFVNRLVLQVHGERLITDRPNGPNEPRPPITAAGNQGAAALALPIIRPVTEDEWGTRGFTEESALVIKHTGDDEENDGARVYDFFVNVDNKYLRTVQKESREDAKLLEAKFTYSLVLIGLALIHDDLVHQRTRAADDGAEHESNDQPEGVEALVARATSALAPVLLPMVETIGGLSLNED